MFIILIEDRPISFMKCNITYKDRQKQIFNYILCFHCHTTTTTNNNNNNNNTTNTTTTTTWK